MPRKTTPKDSPALGNEDTPTVDFEQSLKALEALVERLEGGELPLEQALEAFETGVRLTRECQQALRQAEQKVEILTGSGEGARPVPFEAED